MKILSNILIFCCSIEAGAGLAMLVIVTMADDASLGVQLPQLFQKLGECRLLNRRASVLWRFAVSGTPSDINDTDRVAVVA